MQIARHKTAISRRDLSRPLRVAFADGVLSSGKSVFDYGCGIGDDLRRLRARGFQAEGWDPVHRPKEGLRPSSVVNLGYVVNVIENPAERADTLRKAWDLAGDVLIVSARLSGEGRILSDADDFADGCLTSRGTFQKFFDQHELRNWIDQTLHVSSVPAAPGIFYVFRTEEARSAFLASRWRRRIAVPRLTRSAQLYQQHEQLLQPLLNFLTERGRLPVEGELPGERAICDIFGSLRRTFQVIVNATDAEPWERIARERAQDLLIWLALSRFDGRPPLSRLPVDLQRDVKGFFRSYGEACSEADDLLFSIGEPGVVETACQISQTGKLTPTALYVHESALGSLSPILRLFEGCARGYVGRVEGANIIKLHRQAPKVSYLAYPDFEHDPHPALAYSLTVHFQTFKVNGRDYRSYRNPPILHRKETFLTPDHPLASRFARLTNIEEQKGLYEDPSRIGTRGGWNEVLAEKALYFRGHRLLRRHH